MVIRISRVSLLCFVSGLFYSCHPHETVEPQPPQSLPQPPAKTFSIGLQKDLGNYLPFFDVTSDGGTIFTGQYPIDISGDVIVKKFDASGAVAWKRTFGGIGYEQGSGIVSTKDGGVIVVASISEPSNGGIAGYHFNAAQGTYDIWILKLDANGNLTNQKVIGGMGDEFASAIVETVDGKLILAGSSASTDGDLASVSSHGDKDAWLLKLDADLNILMQKKMGGSGPDAFTSMVLTSSGDILLAAHTQSNDGDVTGFHPGVVGPGIVAGDFWIVRTDINGSVAWKKDFGGSHDDWPLSIIELKDQSIVVSGSTQSSDGDVIGYHNYVDHGVSNVTEDAWVVKLSASGGVLWKKCFGGSGDDGVSGAIKTADGSIFMIGVATSKDGDVLGNHGNADAWIFQLDSDGDLLSQRCWGGSQFDYGNSIRISNGALLFGAQTSSGDGDLAGNQDLNFNSWLVEVP